MKRSYRGLTMLTVSAAILSSCQALKDLTYDVKPNPLEMHGDSVAIEVTVKVPEKGINRKATADVEISVGNQKFETVQIRGEKAVGNGKEINYKEGETYKFEDKIAYTPDMEAADVMVNVHFQKGKKEGDLDPQKIADATIITPLLLLPDAKVIAATDNFVRTTEEKYQSEIIYLKGKADVRNSELSKTEIKTYVEWLKSNLNNPKVEIKNVNMVAYASPEGEIATNDKLADERAASGKEAAKKLAKQAKVDKLADDASYSLQPKGEDWEGFKAALAKLEGMSEDDKNLVVRVLERYSDPNEREQQIRAMAKTYNVLEQKVLPGLRRSQIQVVYDKIGYSDEELKQLATTNPDTLNVEELLFAANLIEDMNQKLAIYRAAEAKFPEDYRCANNVGYVLYMQGDLDGAKAQFEKANGIQENPISKNNLGAVAFAKGERQVAKDLFDEAAGVGDEVNYNQGLIAVQEGKYADAVSKMGSYKTFNKALAELLNGNPDQALSTLDASDDKESADASYLRAIIASRKDNFADVKKHLQDAISKDGKWKAKAAKDREFIKHFENSEFKAIVG